MKDGFVKVDGLRIKRGGRMAAWLDKDRPGWDKDLPRGADGGQLTNNNSGSAKAMDESRTVAAEPKKLPDAGRTSITQERKDTSMSTTPTGAITAEANAMAIARFNTVVASEHYAGNEKFATHLLGNPALSADEITGFLAITPKAASASRAKARSKAVWEKAWAKTNQSKLHGAALASGSSASSSAAVSKASSVWSKAYERASANRSAQ